MKKLFPEIQDSHRREVFRGGAIAFALKLCGIVCSYLFTLLITRGLGVEVMGRFALFITMLTLFSVLGLMGLGQALLRFVSQYFSSEKFCLIRGLYRRAVIGAVISTGLISFILFCFSADVAEKVFRDPRMTLFVRGVSLALPPMALLTLNLQCLRGLRKIKEYVFLKHIIIPLVASALLGASYLLAAREGAPLLAYLAGVNLAFVISLILWLKRYPKTRSSPGSDRSYRALFRVALPMMLANFLLQVLGWTDMIMLGIIGTTGEVGIYSVAMKIAISVTIIAMSVSVIATPKFGELFGRRDLDQLRNVIRYSTRLIFWATLPVILVILLVPSFILGIFGPEFRAGIFALKIITLAQFISSISGPVGHILQMTGKELVFQNIMILSSLVNIGLNLLLIPVYGFNGAALASLVSVAFWNLASIWFVRSHLGIVTVYIPGWRPRVRTGIK